MSKKNPTDLKDVAALYTQSLKDHGTSPKGVGWREDEDHKLRFHKLTQVIQDPVSGFSVNDLGCGYGALYEYLQENDFNVLEFTGFDVSEEMLDEARRRIDAPNVSFVKNSVLDKKADYSFASGIFNVRLKVSEQDWQNHIIASLDNINSMSIKGFSFNLLTSYVDWKEDHLYYGDPCFFFDHCKKNYSSKIALFHDSSLWEWTLTVLK